MRETEDNIYLVDHKMATIVCYKKNFKYVSVWVFVYVCVYVYMYVCVHYYQPSKLRC